MAINIFECKFGNRIIYQKYVTCTMVCLALVLLYGIRHSLSISLPLLITKGGSNNTQRQATRIEWSKGEEYYIFSCFYMGYILSQLPTGAMCDMYASKHFLSLGVLGCGIFNVATPYLILNTHWYYTAGLQFVLGGLQGVCMPALVSLMSHWIPSRQMTFLISYGYSGGCLGTMISYLLASVLIDRLGKWQWLFFFWGSLSFIWYMFYTYLVFSQPSKHPFVSMDERLVMAKEIGEEMAKKIPWCDILSDSAVWALVAGQFGHIFLLFMVDANLPRMFKDLGANVHQNMYLVAMPYMCQWISTISTSYLANYLIGNRYVPAVYIRTVYTAIGNLLPCVFVLISTYVVANRFVLLLCLLAVMACKGTIFIGLKTNILDITRHYGGTVQSIHNGVPTIVGVLAPQLTKYMIKKGTIQEWRRVIWLTVAFSVFTTTLFFLWAKGDKARWDVVKHDKRSQQSSRVW